MERLTIRTASGSANIDYSGCLFQDGKEDYIAKSARRQLAIERLAAYEDTGMEPAEIYQLRGEVFGLRVNRQELKEYRALGSIDRLRELAQADKEGRIRILSAGKGKSCGTCANFQPVPGHKCGDCKVRKHFRASQSRKACSMYIRKDE